MPLAWQLLGSVLFGGNSFERQPQVRRQTLRELQAAELFAHAHGDKPAQSLNLVQSKYTRSGVNASPKPPCRV